MQNTLVLYIVSSIFIFKFSLPYFYIFWFAFLTFCFPPPSLPQMFWWFSRTNETYAFLPRVSWVGTSWISGRRFWGSWETLHAALATGAWQYWCTFITFIHTLPVSKAGQVGVVGVTCLWVQSLKKKRVLELQILPVLSFSWSTNAAHLLLCSLLTC